MSTKVVLVTGWRHHNRRSMIWDALNRAGADGHTIHGNLVIIHGKCDSGADLYADQWGTHFATNVLRFPARNFGNWPSCGPRRNKFMVQVLSMLEADVKEVLAFPKPGWQDPGVVSGTGGCIQLAQEAGFQPKIFELG